MGLESIRFRLLLILAAATAVLIAGTIGFAVIEGYPLFDAFYMALITMTTVGYSEIHTLSLAGRIFNSFVMIFGVGVIFLAIGTMTEFVIAAQLGETFGRRRMKRMIEKLEQHYLLCGYGRVGRSAAAELSRSGVPFIVIDTDATRIEAATKRGYLTMQADASTDETLQEARIGSARGLIAALASDAQNLFLVLSAKALNPSLKVASRVDEEGSEAKLRRAGADATFRPYNITGFRLAQAILRPHVSEFLEFTTSTVDLGMNIGIEQVQVSRQSELASKSLKDMQLRRDLGVIVLAVRRANGAMEFNPSADTVVYGDDFLVVMGDLQHMNRLQELVKGSSS